MGDKLLQSISKRLLTSVRASDTVSRQGGDEFVILLSEIAYPEDAARSAKKLLLSLTAPHSIGGQDLRIDGSIGISVYPEDGEDAKTLIKNADTAMYHAKESGRNNFQFFKPAMNLKAVERQSLEGSLRCALERQEFLLHYQPKVDLITGEITGVEALIRWQRTDRRLLPPSLRVRAHRGRLWPNYPDRPLGAARNVPAGTRMARRRSAVQAGFRQCFRRRVPR